MKTNHSTYRSFGAQTARYFDRAHEAIPQAQLVSPAAWRGSEMRNREDEWLVQLDAADIDELGNAAESHMASNVAMSELHRADFSLPRLSPRLKAWANDIRDGRGFVVVRGIPTDQWGEKKTACAYWGIGHHLGEPGAQNPQGELLGHVVDYDEEGTNPMVRRYRTAGNIDFHCDAADAVGLLCLHPAKSGGQSRIVSSVAVFNEVMRRAPDLIPRLFEPFYLDRRGEQKNNQPGYLQVTPCRWTQAEGLRTFYHSEYFRSAERFTDIEIDAEALKLMDLYDEISASREFQLDMWLQAGDMQFVSNHRILHARTAYEDWPDPERRRHLLRLWTSLA